MTETEALELRERAAHLEAENAKWRARHCRANLILLGNRPEKGRSLGGLERRALALLERAERAEATVDAMVRDALWPRLTANPSLDKTLIDAKESA